MTDKTVDEVLAEAAKATEAASAAKPKKERVKKEGQAPSGEKPAKEPKAPKPPKLYPQWNEDGTPLLDGEGKQVMAETKMKKPKVKREGSGTRISIADTDTLHFTETGSGTKFREGTKRQDNFAAIKDGMTAKDYYDANGGRGVVGTFLIWYVGQGLVEVRRAEEPADKAA